MGKPLATAPFTPRAGTTDTAHSSRANVKYILDYDLTVIRQLSTIRARSIAVYMFAIASIAITAMINGVTGPGIMKIIQAYSTPRKGRVHVEAERQHNDQHYRMEEDRHPHDAEPCNRYLCEFCDVSASPKQHAPHALNR